MLLPLLLATAHAGYGDAVDGYPSYDERVLHLWTDTARVAPEAFEDLYALGGCSLSDFSDDERTPKPPLGYSLELNRAARAHTLDMRDNDWFSHDSSDGTDAFTRIARYYAHPTVGENIYRGQGDPRAAVLSGWMCSATGHRGSIMSGAYTELGVANIDGYLTQDFGGADVLVPAIAMGAHAPAIPTLGVELLASVAGRAPLGVEAWVDGVAYPMTVRWGAPEQGIWRVALDLPLDPEAPVDAPDCHRYHFRLVAGLDVVRFPEAGSWGWGADCAYDDPDAQWFADRLEPGDEICGCRTTSGARWAWLPLSLLLIRRRGSA